MTEWIKYSEQKPKQGMDLWYFFDMVGAHKGQYYGGWLFGGKNGFLQYDVTHWQYDVGQEKPERPEAYRINVPKDTSFLFAFSSSDIPDIHPMKTPEPPTDPTDPTDPTANDSDIEIMRKVCDWYADNEHLFKTNEFYGIDIEADLFRLVKSCMEIK